MGKSWFICFIKWDDGLGFDLFVLGHFFPFPFIMKDLKPFMVYVSAN